MSTPRPSAGGGTRWVTAACGVAGVIGFVLMTAVLLLQQGPPPQPPVITDAPVSSIEAKSTVPGPSVSRKDASSRYAAPAAPHVSEAQALESSVPTQISIPAIGVESTVFPIGLTEDGSLDVPRGQRADQAAWFEGSPTPGETGPSVIEGHVTWSSEPSVFFELGALEPGDRVSVDREDGSTATFEVYDIGRYPKNEFPTRSVYGNTPRSELRLITCGGDTDENGRHLDNTVIYAHLVVP